jgi:hypothetical protein
MPACVSWGVHHSRCSTGNRENVAILDGPGSHCRQGTWHYSSSSEPTAFALWHTPKSSHSLEIIGVPGLSVTGLEVCHVACVQRDR